MSSQKYIIKTMASDEINIAIDWAAAEGWNPGLYDADCFYCADPKGYLIGELDHEPIATLSVVKYGESFGFLGFYIVKPEFRGKGYGIQIWEAGLKYLKGRNVGLDGVLAQQTNYQKSGFKLAYRNIRFEGNSSGQLSQLPENSEIIKLSTLPFEMIDFYDRQLFPAARSLFIKSWIRQPASNALGIMRDGKFAGYGVIRKCRNGFKIGPLMANNSELAESLFLSLTADVNPAEPTCLDIPEVNQKALALAERYNMKVVFETARMYTGDNPDISLDKIFGVTSFELG